MEREKTPTPAFVESNEIKAKAFYRDRVVGCSKNETKKLKSTLNWYLERCVKDYEFTKWASDEFDLTIDEVEASIKEGTR